MKPKKGELWKIGDPELRGLSRGSYYYCVMADEEKYIMSDVIVTQSGDILLSKDIEMFDNERLQQLNLVPSSLEDFMKIKDNIKTGQIISFTGHKKYDHGIILEVDSKNKKLLVEVEDADKCQYKEVKVLLENVTIVYPTSWSFNNRRQYSKC